MLIVLLAMNIFLVTEIKNVFAALVGTIIWIPIFQSFEPPVQKLGLASVLFAFTLRNSNVFLKILYCIQFINLSVFIEARLFISSCVFNPL
ncbi:hypothetical protein LEP1GSC150_2745 [Leptospira interrogans serovar Copenhageni str. LT2050]|uniref:Uncharacterized protein n=1 Tax=Leptospira interrogans serovar Copenhageni str. LT2050 TaxID=1001598 RepID=M3GFT5_LEPIT|nr:hypothetical protein LEP1GSC150_2745 [Leptospira interrogans serovar Copenhageni str. LT2050]